MCSTAAAIESFQKNNMPPLAFEMDLEPRGLLGRNYINGVFMQTCCAENYLLFKGVRKLSEGASIVNVPVALLVASHPL